jgi:ribose transport system permease protein
MTKPGTPQRSDKTPLGRSVLAHLKNTNVAITLVAVVLFLYFSLEADNFFSKDTVLEMLRASAYVAIVAAAWTLLLIVGELDLSVGSLYTLLAVVMALLMRDHGLGMWTAFFVIVLLGALIGAAQGFVVTSLGVPSFIVTLGTLSLFSGLALTLSQSTPVDVAFESDSSFLKYGGGLILGVPAPVFWMAGVCALCAGILRFTPLGYHVYATGGNEKASRQAGIGTAVVKLFCFALVGATVAVAGGLTLAQLGSANPVAAGEFNLTVIAAVIIGGVALTGGVGYVYGAFIGSLILGMVSTGIVLMGFSADLHYVISGSIIVGAGVIYTVLHGGLPQSGIVGRIGTILARHRVARTSAASAPAAAASPAQRNRS